MKQDRILIYHYQEDISKPLPHLLAARYLAAIPTVVQAFLDNATQISPPNLAIMPQMKLMILPDQVVLYLLDLNLKIKGTPKSGVLYMERYQTNNPLKGIATLTNTMIMCFIATAYLQLFKPFNNGEITENPEGGLIHQGLQK
jgi:hypothetical protein